MAQGIYDLIVLGLFFVVVVIAMIGRVMFAEKVGGAVRRAIAGGGSRRKKRPRSLRKPPR